MTSSATHEKTVSRALQHYDNAEHDASHADKRPETDLHARVYRHGTAEWNSERERQCGHPHYRAHAERNDLQESERDRFHTCDGEYDQGGGTCHAMHRAHSERAQRKTRDVHMTMPHVIVRRGVVRV